MMLSTEEALVVPSLLGSHLTLHPSLPSVGLRFCSLIGWSVGVRVCHEASQFWNLTKTPDALTFVARAAGGDSRENSPESHSHCIAIAAEGLPTYHAHY